MFLQPQTSFSLKFRIIYLQRPKPYCKKKPLLCKATRNSKVSSATKAGLSKLHGVAALTVKLRLRMRQGLLLGFDLSKEKSRRLIAFTAGKLLRKLCISRVHIDSGLVPNFSRALSCLASSAKP